MNKIINKAFVALTAIFALTLFACVNEYEYDAAPVPGSASGTGPGQQVYFGSTAATIETPKTANSFEVVLKRVNVVGEAKVPVKIEMGEGSIYKTAANEVTFADSCSEASLTFTYNPDDIVYGTYYDIAISLGDSTQGTPYGLTSYAFKAGMSEWKKMAGKAIYRDDFINSLWGAGAQAWEVDIEESVVTPGRYRLIAPYSSDTDFRNNPLWGSDTEIEDYYLPSPDDDVNMVIDATDPDYVYIEACASGLKDLPTTGMMGFTSYAYYYMTVKGMTLEDLKASYGALFGTLKDGVISFRQPQTLLITIDGALKWYGNANNLFAIALPGYSLKDYAAEAEYTGLFTNPEGQAFAMFNLTLGADATDVKAVIVAADEDPAAVADLIAEGELEATEVEGGNIQMAVPEDANGKLMAVFVVFDGTDVKTVATAEFEYYTGAQPWKALGTGYYTDDFVFTLYGDSQTGLLNTPLTYEVNIEESTETPGLYRLKQCYNYIAELFQVEGGKKDIEIHAESPSAVYFMKQATGLDLGEGEFSIESEAGFVIDYYSKNYTLEQVIAAIPQVFGKVTDGIITMPSLPRTDEEGNPRYDDDHNPLIYQGTVYFGNNELYAGLNGGFKVVLPSAASSVKAKARSAERATKFINRLNAYNIKKLTRKPMSRKQMPLVKAKAWRK